MARTGQELLSSLLPDAELSAIVGEDEFDLRVRDLGLTGLSRSETAAFKKRWLAQRDGAMRASKGSGKLGRAVSEAGGSVEPSAAASEHGGDAGAAVARGGVRKRTRGADAAAAPAPEESESHVDAAAAAPPPAAPAAAGDGSDGDEGFAVPRASLRRSAEAGQGAAGQSQAAEAIGDEEGGAIASGAEAPQSFVSPLKDGRPPLGAAAVSDSALQPYGNPALHDVSPHAAARDSAAAAAGAASGVLLDAPLAAPAVSAAMMRASAAAASSAAAIEADTAEAALWDEHNARVLGALSSFAVTVDLAKRAAAAAAAAADASGSPGASASGAAAAGGAAAAAGRAVAHLDASEFDPFVLLSRRITTLAPLLGPARDARFVDHTSGEVFSPDPHAAVADKWQAAETGAIVDPASERWCLRKTLRWWGVCDRMLPEGHDTAKEEEEEACANRAAILAEVQREGRGGGYSMLHALTGVPPS